LERHKKGGAKREIPLPETPKSEWRNR